MVSAMGRKTVPEMFCTKVMAEIAGAKSAGGNRVCGTMTDSWEPIPSPTPWRTRVVAHQTVDVSMSHVKRKAQDRVDISEEAMISGV